MHSNCFFFNQTNEKLYSKNALTLPLQVFFHSPIDSHICVCVCLLLDFLHVNTNKCKLIYILFFSSCFNDGHRLSYIYFFNIIISQMSHHVKVQRMSSVFFFFLQQNHNSSQQFYGNQHAQGTMLNVLTVIQWHILQKHTRKHIFISSPFMDEEAKIYESCSNLTISRFKVGI